MSLFSHYLQLAHNRYAPLKSEGPVPPTVPEHLRVRWPAPKDEWADWLEAATHGKES